MIPLLVAVTVNDTMHPDLQARAMELIRYLMAEPRNRKLFDMELAWYGEFIEPGPPGSGKWYRLAEARNRLLDAYLRPEHDYVLWVDADLVDYPADLPALLYEANPDITAPMIFLEGTEDIFYDTLGFVENRSRTSRHPPYFRHLNGQALYDLDGVGCTYLIPADILRDVRYESLPVDYERDGPSVWRTGHTDHWPVMREARRRGLRVACLTTVRAYHADLPKYGEAFH